MFRSINVLLKPGLKLTEADQELYKNFPLVISERWQTEVNKMLMTMMVTMMKMSTVMMVMRAVMSERWQTEVNKMLLMMTVMMKGDDVKQK